MERVRGLAPKTRSAALRIVRELLWGRFHDRPVVLSALKPEQVRCCFARLTQRCHAPLSTGAVVSALHGYFRFRAACGDTVHALMGVLSHPANWQQTALPTGAREREHHAPLRGGQLGNEGESIGTTPGAEDENASISPRRPAVEVPPAAITMQSARRPHRGRICLSRVNYA